MIKWAWVHRVKLVLARKQLTSMSHRAEAIIIILIFPCFCYAECQDARQHPTNVMWLIEMPLGRLLWFELISGVRRFRHTCSTELDTVSKAVEQHHADCRHTPTEMHCHNCKQRQTNRDRNTHTEKGVDRQADRCINIMREWQKHYFSW